MLYDVICPVSSQQRESLAQQFLLILANSVSAHQTKSLGTMRMLIYRRCGPCSARHAQQASEHQEPMKTNCRSTLVPLFDLDAQFRVASGSLGDNREQ